MATNTARAGLIKPDGTEARSVDPLNTNFTTIDKFLGYILVNDGVTPPTGDLFDGALVKEKTSGIIWEARKNGGGTFDKVYVRYPYFIVSADNTNPSQASGTTYVASVTQVFESGKNASGSNIVNGKWVAPIKGIYNIWAKVAFVSNGTGERALSIRKNGSEMVGYNIEDIRTGASSGGQATHLHITYNDLLSVNDEVTPTAWQNSGGALSRPMARLRIALIEPVQ